MIHIVCTQQTQSNTAKIDLYALLDLYNASKSIGQLSHHTQQSPQQQQQQQQEQQQPHPLRLTMDDLIESVLLALDVDSDRSLPKLVQFRLVPSNSEKVQVIEELLDDWAIERPSSPPPAAKSNQRSVEFMRCGDRWLQRNRPNHHFEALLNYNEAIAFAETGTRQLAVGYARRTVVYFEWRLYALCLENVQLARNAAADARDDSCSAAADDDWLAELAAREQLCRDALAAAEHADAGDHWAPPDDEAYTPQLSFAAHPTVPFIADCLDIRENEQYGRYIITHRALQPGQVLAVEDRYLNVLLPKLRHQRCAHCLRENALSLIPCAGCTAAMFCSRRCANSAQHTYHPYECPIIDYLHANCDRFHLSALRATIMAFVGLKSVERVEQVVAQGDKLPPVTAFTVNHRKRAVAQKYMQVHTFPTKQQQRETPDLIATAVVVASLCRHLLVHTKFCELVSDQRGRAVLQELLFRHLQISRMYFHSLSSADRQYRSDGGGLRGTGVYPFCSLINHACTPNIVRVPFGTKMVVIVLRPIGAGEQLFDNYG